MHNNDQKTLCEQSAALTLQSTTEKTGDLSMGYKREIIDSNEESRGHHKKQKEYEPHRELWSSLADRYNSIDKDASLLSKDELLYFSVGILV